MASGSSPAPSTARPELPVIPAGRSLRTLLAAGVSHPAPLVLPGGTCSGRCWGVPSPQTWPRALQLLPSPSRVSLPVPVTSDGGPGCASEAVGFVAAWLGVWDQAGIGGRSGSPKAQTQPQLSPDLWPCSLRASGCSVCQQRGHGEAGGLTPQLGIPEGPGPGPEAAMSWQRLQHPVRPPRSGASARLTICPRARGSAVPGALDWASSEQSAIRTSGCADWGA